MVAGSEADSISALVTAIQNRIETPAAAAVVAIGSAVSRDDVVAVTNGSGLFVMEFFHDADGAGSGAPVSYSAVAYGISATEVFVIVRDGANEVLGSRDFVGDLTLGNLVDYLNGIAALPVNFDVLGNQLIMAADQRGASTIGLKISEDPIGQVGVIANDGGYYIGTGTDAQAGDLGGVISSVTQSNGVITLTSANKQQEQFSIGKAEIDYAGEKQVVTVTFDDANASYYDLANYGSDGSGSFVGTRSEIGVTLHGRTFTQAMFTTGDEVLTAAERTVAALEAQIEAARLETDGATPTAFATWLNANIGTIEIVDDGSGHLTALRFTAKNPNSADLIDLSESFTTVAPTIQQTRLDFAGINFDGDGRLTQTGQSAKVQVSIAGTVITANQTATEAGSLHNLVEQILIARDGTGTKAPGGYSEGQFLMLTSPASALLGHDIFTVRLTVDGQDVSFAVDPLALSETNGAGRATVADLGAALAYSIETRLAGYTASYDAVTGALAVSDAQSNLATVSVNSGGLAYKTYTLSDTGANATVSSVLDKVTFDGVGDIVLTAKNAGVDPLHVSTEYQMEDKTSIDGKPHIINLTFDNSTFDTAEETPIGTVIAVKIDGITAQVTIDETLSSAANRSEAIVAALKAAIIAADDAAGTGSMIGTVKQGSLNGSTLIEAGETLADGQNVLQITADRNGAHLLGRAVDGTLSIRVTAPGDVTVPLAATAGVAQIGNIVYAYQSGSDLLSDVMQGRNEGVLTFETGADSPVYKVGASTIVGETYLVPDLSTSGSDGITNTPESQTITNAGFESGDNSRFFGDQAKIGALTPEGFNGEGVLQSFVNPDGSYTATSGSSIANAAGASSGNATFYGDDAALGATGGIRQAFTNPDDDYSHTASSTRTGAYDETGGNDVYFGDDALSGPDGVKQTYTNPSSGYTAIDNSPQLDAQAGTGNLDLTGSDPGYYADEGLYTTWLNGLTPLEDNPGSNKDLYAPDVITVNDTVNEGDAASTTQVAESDIDNDKTGFAAFTWDNALQALVTQGNAGPDVIHNFQGGANGDVILLEGGLAASTLDGDVDYKEGALRLGDPINTFVSSPDWTDTVRGVQGQFSVLSLGLKISDPNAPLSYNGYFKTTMYIKTDWNFNLVKFTLDTHGETVVFENTAAFVDAIVSSADAGNPNWQTVRDELVSKGLSFDINSQGDLLLSVPTLESLSGNQTVGFSDANADTYAAFMFTTYEQMATAFDLSTNEFGLVGLTGPH